MAKTDQPQHVKDEIKHLTATKEMFEGHIKARRNKGLEPITDHAAGLAAVNERLAELSK